MNWRQPAGHHQPDWETDESLYGETNELETVEGRQMNSRQPISRQPDWETNEPLSWETKELETVEEPDTTSQTWRQANES